MKQAARNIAWARADNTARISSIRRQDGDGDVNLTNVWPTITRVCARRAEPELEEGWRVRVAPPRYAGSTAWKHAGGRVRASAGGTARKRAGSTAWTSAGNTAGTWTALSYVYSESTTTEGCHGTRPDEHNT